MKFRSLADLLRHVDGLPKTLHAGNLALTVLNSEMEQLENTLQLVELELKAIRKHAAQVVKMCEKAAKS